MFFVIKVLLSAIFVASVSEIAKRSTVLAALVIGLPINSLLTFFWLYVETKKTDKIYPLAWQITLGAIPSTVFLIALAVLLKKGISVGPALVVALCFMVGTQILYVFSLQKMGYNLY